MVNISPFFVLTSHPSGLLTTSIFNPLSPKATPAKNATKNANLKFDPVIFGKLLKSAENLNGPVYQGALNAWVATVVVPRRTRVRHDFLLGPRRCCRIYSVFGGEEWKGTFTTFFLLEMGSTDGIRVFYAKWWLTMFVVFAFTFFLLQLRSLRSSDKFENVWYWLVINYFFFQHDRLKEYFI